MWYKLLLHLPQYNLYLNLPKQQKVAFYLLITESVYQNAIVISWVQLFVVIFSCLKLSYKRTMDTKAILPISYLKYVVDKFSKKLHKRKKDFFFRNCID